MNTDRKPLSSFNEFVEMVTNYVDVYNPQLLTPVEVRPSEEIRREVFGPADVWTIRPSTLGEIDPVVAAETLRMMEDDNAADIVYFDLLERDSNTPKAE